MNDDGSGSRPRILIAEDDALFLYTLKLIASMHGDVAGEAMDGPEAVELAQQLSPDIVLLDLTMPRFGGMEAMRRIRESDSHVRIVIVSSHSSAFHVNDALEHGADGYIFKGAAMDQIPRAIETVMSGRKFHPADGVHSALPEKT